MKISVTFLDTLHVFKASKNSSSLFFSLFHYLHITILQQYYYNHDVRAIFQYTVLHENVQK